MFEKMTEIKTFVFFDLETTGLPDFEGSRTKITEIALIACSKEHLMNTSKGELPRVLHKLTLCVNPMKLIQPASTEITGLDNYLLEQIKKFDGNTAKLLKCFMMQLQSPICLIAHNGNKFDFPILRKHMLNMDASFDPDLLCADSLDIFKKFDEIPITVSAFDELLNIDLRQVQQLNEKTPCKKIKKVEAISKLKTPYQKPTSSRCLFPSETDSNAKISESPNKDIETPKKRISYKLTDIYKRLHSSPPEVAHNAEADALHLLKCAIGINTEFIRLAECNSIKLVDIKPLGAK